VSNWLSVDNEHERFLHGPVPLPWFKAAARLPGRSLHVGMVLWDFQGRCRFTSAIRFACALALTGMPSTEPCGRSGTPSWSR
jgi:hypothetical protein